MLTTKYRISTAEYRDVRWVADQLRFADGLNVG